MAHYLITGCAGFIGSRVCETLLKMGHEVSGIDNLNDAYDIRLKHWRLDGLKQHEHFHFHKVDLTDMSRLGELFSNSFSPAAVIHLAARAGVRQSILDPVSYINTNLTGTTHLLELCRQHGIRKFVLASSSSVYGQSKALPYCETQDTDQPLSPYAATKKAAEVMSHAYHHLNGIDVSVFRFFTVYGPAGRPDMSIFRFVQWIFEGRPVTIYGDGNQARDFTYVDDVVDGIIAGLSPLGFEVINLGSDHPVKLIELIEMLERLSGRKAQVCCKPAHPADVPATWADISKARRLLNWSPQVSFEAGLEQVVEWYIQNRTWAKSIQTSDVQ